MAYDPDNVFAKILRGELPSHKVFEDESTLAFMDVMPQTKGHTLVVPKSPAENLFDLPEDLLAATIVTTKRVATAVKAAFQPPGMMIGQTNGLMAGQTVFHLHFHIIPRYEASGFRFQVAPQADPEVLAAHAEAIRAHIGD
jgi:histidine triad (HIT) family protein